MKTYEIVIADDSERARKAVRMILDSDPQFRVVAEATNGQEAISKTQECMPDLVLMDINMPVMNGFEATRIIKQELPYVRVVILSVSDDAADLFEAIRHGAQGYLVKSLKPSDWVSYLHGILDGETPVSRKMAEKLLAEFKFTASARGVPATPSEKLTAREQEILELVSTGATNREIAAKLFISENTVKNHLKNIMAKLHIQNRVQLATYARENRTNKA
ncbi:response regulator transcription factor [Alicyclobacillus cycloheptanicus]|uniref:DNA-binding NarL/FixJ family response regulator n=1 Tax=Alicyclobacillus cycloheptanicus TaxID=1457 RepID=A0ABT9XHU0_9BACL|nr:response regulator transcription factor [Alicyclobacillus cycloheptanicus]MDQ0189680.1 DNA-binding NarL/FixJ family response regulator [Alicyclobacillus cycloheptanicus]WDL99977.1 response regulator transcription factor [Alicyclobacillus cycloheptanicus]